VFHTYVADFGIVEERADAEQVNLVLSIRTDAQPGSAPEPLNTLEAQAEDIIDSVPAGDWRKVTADVATIDRAWQAYQSQAKNDHIPQPFQDALTAALDHLQKSAAAKDAPGIHQAANDVSAAVVDRSLYTIPRCPPIWAGSMYWNGRSYWMCVATMVRPPIAWPKSMQFGLGSSRLSWPTMAPMWLHGLWDGTQRGTRPPTMGEKRGCGAGATFLTAPLRKPY
jgi:hypothetical protein